MTAQNPNLAALSAVMVRRWMTVATGCSGNDMSSTTPGGTVTTRRIFKGKACSLRLRATG